MCADTEGLQKDMVDLQGANIQDKICLPKTWGGSCC